MKLGQMPRNQDTTNGRMLAEGKPDMVIAFPGDSGTGDMMRQAERAGVPVVKITERADQQSRSDSNG